MRVKVYLWFINDKQRRQMNVGTHKSQHGKYMQLSGTEFRQHLVERSLTEHQTNILSILIYFIEQPISDFPNMLVNKLLVHLCHFDSSHGLPGYDCSDGNLQLFI